MRKGKGDWKNEKKKSTYTLDFGITTRYMGKLVNFLV